MGTSFIAYKGEGFWAKDFHLVGLAQAVRSSGIPNWFPEDLAEYYAGLSEDQVGVGCITLWLDEMLITSEQVQWFEVVVKNAELKSLYQEEFKACLLKLIKGDLLGKPDSGFYYWQGTKNF